MLQIYNSYSKQKEIFKPIEPNKVRMYVCGITVYDLCHLGHARMFVVFDVVFRYLQRLGYDVTYVRNITDIDDKIIKRAAENGENYFALTQRYIDLMHKDCRALGVLPPTLEPKATENIDEIIDMISTLMEKGYAYQAQNKDVYYRVKQFEPYGGLSGRKIDELRAGERVDIDEHKEDPLDFVLWKAAKSGEPSWPSPWGEGRPGWHIECSAMSTRFLGHHFDIHGGGMDLQFPHHENEIAQSEACTGEQYVNYWMHNGFIRMDGEKMSKSLGNFFTVQDIMKRFRPEEIRFFILSSHYRSPLSYTDANLQNARSSLSRLYTALRDWKKAGSQVETPEPSITAHTERFERAMNDDFNTPEAFAVLFDMVAEVNRHRDENPEYAQSMAHALRENASVLGLLQEDAEVYLQSAPAKSGDNELEQSEIEALIAERSKARHTKNWAESDRIRDYLKDRGVILEDNGSETIWRRK
ncbi:MAG: cysteine--tRNA ligase [Gammaproteobacteria bacterium]|nr:cysteine--tRNA ligase [Gammaproteobacteria bacterium]